MFILDLLLKILAGLLPRWRRLCRAGTSSTATISFCFSYLRQK